MGEDNGKMKRKEERRKDRRSPGSHHQVGRCEREKWRALHGVKF